MAFDHIHHGALALAIGQLKHDTGMSRCWLNRQTRDALDCMRPCALLALLATLVKAAQGLWQPSHTGRRVNSCAAR